MDLDGRLIPERTMSDVTVTTTKRQKERSTVNYGTDCSGIYQLLASVKIRFISRHLLKKA